MPIPLRLPIYKTDVVRVSDMPSLNILDDSAVFYAVSNGRSYKISYKLLKAAIAEEIAKAFHKEIADLKSKVSALSSRLKAENAVSGLATSRRRTKAERKENTDK